MNKSVVGLPKLFILGFYVSILRSGGERYKFSKVTLKW